MRFGKKSTAFRKVPARFRTAKNGKGLDGGVRGLEGPGGIGAPNQSRNAGSGRSAA